MSFKNIAFFLTTVLLSQLLHCQTEVFFEKITSDSGLSQNDVLALYQDHLGYIWAGTNDGLNKYNGYEFKTYKPNPSSLNSISSNLISCITEDKLGNLWIGTTGSGINIFNRNTEKFTRISSQTNSSGHPRLSNDFVKSIFFDSKDRVWIVTNEGIDVGYNIYDKDKLYFENPFNESQIKKPIETVFEDKNGNILIGGIPGLYYAEESQNKVEKITLISLEGVPIRNIAYVNDQIVVATGYGLFLLKNYKNPSKKFWFRRLNPQPSTKITIDKSGHIWSATNHGLDEFKFTKDKNNLNLVNKYVTNIENPNSLNSNFIKSLLIDKTGIIWVGTLGGGINKLNFNRKKFKHYNSTLNPGTIGNNVVRTLFKDSNGTLWVGTQGGGLNMLLKQKHQNNYSNFKKIEEINNSISICELNIAGRKVLQVGTSHARGLYEIDITTPSNTPPIKNLLDLNEFVFKTYEDSHGQVWYGSYQNGLYRKKSADSDQFIQFGSENGLKSDIIRNIFEDSKGNLWVGTGNGLSKLSKNQIELNDLEFKTFRNDLTDSSSLSHNYILQIFESSEGDIFIGTLGGGLNKYVKDSITGKEYFEKFTENEGLVNNTIKSIEEDNNKNLWISTNNGLSKFNLATNTFKNYNKSDGLQANEFQELSSLKLDNGDIMFGGVNGFNVFTPELITDNLFPPKVVLDNLYVQNEVVNINEKYNNTIILKKPLSLLDTITLKYFQNNFSIKFSGLHFSSPIKNQYAYRLKGFNDTWVSTSSSSRIATYTNIEPGTYTFEVKGSNNDGIWSENSTNLQIIVTHPFWKTGLAYAVYFLLGVLVLYFLGKYTVIKTTEKHVLLMDNLTTEKNKELNDMKMHFFTNVSHEFRTPISLINGPLQYLEKNNSVLDSNERLVQYRIMQKNSSLLLRLVNQLLDFQKIDRKKMTLKVNYQDILEAVREIIESFEFIAKNRNIKLKLHASENEIITWFSQDAIEKVLNNLISNAFKFTPDNGKIDIIIKNVEGVIKDKTTPCLTIMVKDNGSGISPKSLDKIFDRFFNDDSAENRNSYSMGIGLALTKSLIQLHHGSIYAESDENGASFIITIPKDFDYYKSDKIMESQSFKKADVLPNILEKSQMIIDEASMIEDPQPKNDKVDILIVEDNPDMRTFIKSGLQRDYNIIEAENGDIALKMVLENAPTIIVSDIMMPVMDGIEFVKQVKQNNALNHIPIIFLTAKANDKNLIEGIKTGADDYITKPFDLEYLKLKISNIVEYRVNLRKHIQHKVSIDPKEIYVASPDEEFLNKAVELLEANIMDTEFNVDNLVEEMSISRSAIYPKFKELTGLSLGEFIRRFRLKRAKQLLETTDLSIKEIMYLSGFNTASYFAKCFKKMYGEVPTNYRKTAPEE